MRIRDDDFGGGYGHAVTPKLSDCSCEKRSRKPLADSGNCVERARSEFAKKSCAVQHPFEFAENARVG